MNVMPPLPEIPGVRILNIPNWDGYAVTDEGDIWTCLAARNPSVLRNGRYAKTWHLRAKKKRTISGHLWVRLHAGDGSTLSTGVQRLVLEAFVGPCPRGMEARHLDSNPANCRLSNLEWNTRKVNQCDRKANGTVTPRGKDGKFRSNGEPHKAEGLIFSVI